jgi:hypothetical protein
VSQARKGEQLRCPRCGPAATRAEWVVVFRRLAGYDRRLPPLSVLKHKMCKGLVYVPLGLLPSGRALRGRCDSAVLEKQRKQSVLNSQVGEC